MPHLILDTHAQSLTSQHTHTLIHTCPHACTHTYTHKHAYFTTSYWLLGPHLSSQHTSVQTHTGTYTTNPPLPLYLPLPPSYLSLRNITSLDLSLNKLSSEGLYVFSEGLMAGNTSISLLIMQLEIASLSRHCHVIIASLSRHYHVIMS